MPDTNSPGDVKNDVPSPSGPTKFHVLSSLFAAIWNFALSAPTDGGWDAGVHENRKNVVVDVPRSMVLDTTHSSTPVAYVPLAFRARDTSPVMLVSIIPLCDEYPLVPVADQFVWLNE